MSKKTTYAMLTALIDENITEATNILKKILHDKSQLRLAEPQINENAIFDKRVSIALSHLQAIADEGELTAHEVPNHIQEYVASRWGTEYGDKALNALCIKVLRLFKAARPDIMKPSARRYDERPYNDAGEPNMTHDQYVRSRGAGDMDRYSSNEDL